MSRYDFSSENGSLGLPPEILVEIFARCLPSDRTRLSKPPQLLPPFTLAHVCSLWHKLVLSSPRLWNRIVLGYYGTDSARESIVLDVFLARAASETMPLDLVLVPQSNDGLQVMLNQESNAKYERDTTAFIKKVCANASRLRTLDLDVLDADVLEPLFSILTVPDTDLGVTAPRLESFKLSTTHLGSANGVRRLPNLALACPRLRNVSLMCPPLIPAPPTRAAAAHGRETSTVLSDMRALRLRFCTAFEHALGWVDVCPNLERLSVQLFTRTNNIDENPEIDEFDGLDGGEEINEEIEDDGLDGDGWVLVPHRGSRLGSGTHPNNNINMNAPQTKNNKNVRILAHLTHLELHSFSTPSSIGAVLDALALPALKSLRISTSISRFGPGNLDFNARWVHIPLLLQRSEPPLEELAISNTPMNADDIRACLMLAPRLKRLSVGISDSEEVDVLLDDLTVPQPPSRVDRSVLEDNDNLERSPHQARTRTHLCPELEVLDITESSFTIDALTSMISSRLRNTSFEFESEGLDIPRVTPLKEVRVNENLARTVREDPVIKEYASDRLKLTGAKPGVRLISQVDVALQH